jgi:hypothetical protein
MPPVPGKKDASTSTGPEGREGDGATSDKPDKPFMEKTSNRPYSIVVWGATGFTGSLVCKHIAHEYPVR